jgi:LacI family transcriptional regulator
MTRVPTKPNDTPLTLRGLAKLAGCSATTVSLALRGDPSLPARTQDRIKKLAAKHGYRRNTVVSTLMTQLRFYKESRYKEKLAVLTWGDNPAVVKQNPRGAELHEGIRERAHALGYDIETIWASEPGLTGAKLTKMLYARGIRGVVVTSKQHARGHMSLDWRHFAAATTSYTVLRPNLHRATPAFFDGMVEALRQLKRRGYVRVAYVNVAEQEDQVNDGWLAGYLTYTYRSHKEITVPPLLQPVLDKNAFSAWLIKYRPEAIVSCLPEYLAMLKELGYRVPEEIGFVNLDCLSNSEPFSGIDQIRRNVGARTVDLVVEQIECNELGLPGRPKTTTVHGVWHNGSTLLSHRK